MDERAKHLAIDIGAKAQTLKAEYDDFRAVQDAKMTAEDAVLESVIAAIRPALPALSSRINLGGGIAVRGVAIGPLCYLSEIGQFHDDTLSVLSTTEAVDRLSLTGIVACLLAALANQRGRLLDKTREIRREAAVLEGIAAAFKLGGVK